MHEAGRRDVKTAFALNHFNHDSGHIFRRDIGFEQHFECGQRIFFGNAMIGHGEGRTENAAGHWAEIVFVGQHFARHGQGHHSAAVVAAVETDDAVATCRAARNLDGIFECFCTGVKHAGFGAVTGDRGDFAELFRELNVWRVRHDRLAGMHNLVELRLDRRNHFRVAMADIENTDTAGEINHALSVCIPDLGVLRAVGELRIRTGCAGSDVFFLESLKFSVVHKSSPG